LYAILPMFNKLEVLKAIIPPPVVCLDILPLLATLPNLKRAEGTFGHRPMSSAEVSKPDQQFAAPSVELKVSVETLR
ncbi:hypothetical protein, partial [Escherichia coli]|uniref:hypothetical protein n=1 Tax=Escherichia coli TaxID=562 RepID=UPI00398AD3D0